MKVKPSPSPRWYSWSNATGVGSITAIACCSGFRWASRCRFWGADVSDGPIDPPIIPSRSGTVAQPTGRLQHDGVAYTGLEATVGVAINWDTSLTVSSAIRSQSNRDTAHSRAASPI